MKSSRIIITALLLVYCFAAIPSYGQKYRVFYGGRLTGVAESERNDVFTEIAKEAVLKYAPEYYREYRKPDIYGESVFYTGIDEFNSFTCITFFYDPTKEMMKEDFAVAVIVDPRTGVATDILLGNGVLLKDIDKGGGGTPVEWVPSWSADYDPENYSRAEQLKIELLWGKVKEEKTRMRLLMEKTFITDSITAEIHKVFEVRKVYEPKRGESLDISAEVREQKIDSLTGEYRRLLDERRKSRKSYEDKGI